MNLMSIGLILYSILLNREWTALPDAAPNCIGHGRRLLHRAHLAFSAEQKTEFQPQAVDMSRKDATSIVIAYFFLSFGFMYAAFVIFEWTRNQIP